MTNEKYKMELKNAFDPLTLRVETVIVMLKNYREEKLLWFHRELSFCSHFYQQLSFV
jgi:hypothetical protein